MRNLGGGQTGALPTDDVEDKVVDLGELHAAGARLLGVVILALGRLLQVGPCDITEALQGDVRVQAMRD